MCPSPRSSCDWAPYFLPSLPQRGALQKPLLQPLSPDASPDPSFCPSAVFSRALTPNILCDPLSSPLYLISLGRPFYDFTLTLNPPFALYFLPSIYHSYLSLCSTYLFILFPCLLPPGKTAAPVGQGSCVLSLPYPPCT